MGGRVIPHRKIRGCDWPKSRHVTFRTETSCCVAGQYCYGIAVQLGKAGKYVTAVLEGQQRYKICRPLSTLRTNKTIFH